MGMALGRSTGRGEGSAVLGRGNGGPCPAAGSGPNDTGALPAVPLPPPAVVAVESDRAGDASSSTVVVAVAVAVAVARPTLKGALGSQGGTMQIPTLPRECQRSRYSSLFVFNSVPQSWRPEEAGRRGQLSAPTRPALRWRVGSWGRCGTGSSDRGGPPALPSRPRAACGQLFTRPMPRARGSPPPAPPPSTPPTGHSGHSPSAMDFPCSPDGQPSSALCNLPRRRLVPGHGSVGAGAPLEI